VEQTNVNKLRRFDRAIPEKMPAIAGKVLVRSTALLR
jgi:hypothetical protein